MMTGGKSITSSVPAIEFIREQVHGHSVKKAGVLLLLSFRYQPPPESVQEPAAATLGNISAAPLAFVNHTLKFIGSRKPSPVFWRMNGIDAGNP